MLKQARQGSRSLFLRAQPIPSHRRREAGARKASATPLHPCCRLSEPGGKTVRRLCHVTVASTARPAQSKEATSSSCTRSRDEMLPLLLTGGRARRAHYRVEIPLPGIQDAL